VGKKNEHLAVGESVIKPRGGRRHWGGKKRLGFCGEGRPLGIKKSGGEKKRDEMGAARTGPMRGGVGGHIIQAPQETVEQR